MLVNIYIFYLKQEYDDLLKFTVVVPQFDPKIGTQVLENAKGLFMTTELQLKLRQHLQQQKLVTFKYEEKNSLKSGKVILNDQVDEVEEIMNKTNDDTLDGNLN